MERVLTSGGEPSVFEGSELLNQLLERYGNRITIMPGGGIKAHNIERVLKMVRAEEYHMNLHASQPSKMSYRKDHIHMGGVLRQEEYLIQHTDERKVQAVIDLMTQYGTLS